MDSLTAIRVMPGDAAAFTRKILKHVKSNDKKGFETCIEQHLPLYIQYCTMRRQSTLS